MYLFSGKVFINCSIEYFGTTKSRIFEIEPEDILDPNKKKRLTDLHIPALENALKNGLIDLLETAEYLSNNIASPYPCASDLTGELLEQLRAVDYR